MRRRLPCQSQFILCNQELPICVQHIPKGKFTLVADSGRITGTSEVIHLDEKRPNWTSGRSKSGEGFVTGSYKGM